MFLHEYEIAVLDFLKKERHSDLETIVRKLDISSDSALWAIENLASKGAIRVQREHTLVPKLTKEGNEYLRGFPEEKLVSQLSKSGGSMHMSAIKDQIGLIWAKKNGWARVDAGKLSITPSGKEIASGSKDYAYRTLLKELVGAESGSKAAAKKNVEMISTLKSRNLIEVNEKSTIKSIAITDQGSSISPASAGEGIGQLTREIITTGKWEREKFRKYDINAPSEEQLPARLHPLHEFLDNIRSIWLNMGFTELSGPIVEPAFWVFDALFSPQDHPTREMQDTFFLKNPSELSIDDITLLKRVRQMHVKGWKEKWNEEIAKQAILRTHTTSVSARSIGAYGNMEAWRYPLKFFSVGRTFRNENIDYKHLAEFYMVDGIIIGDNLTLSNLIYTLKQFYSQLGMENLVFRPAYFPFVEPGLEIYYYDEKKKDSIELGGAGIIRREITRAMGTNKTVLAWGPGLDRLMFKALEVDSISELYRNDVGWLRKRRELKF